MAKTPAETGVYDDTNRHYLLLLLLPLTTHHSLLTTEYQTKIFLIQRLFFIFVVMTTLTVNIDNKKTEKAIKVVLDAFGLNYDIKQAPEPAQRPLNKSEQVIYNRLKKSIEEINLYKEGKIKLQDAREFLNEL